MTGVPRPEKLFGSKYKPYISKILQNSGLTVFKWLPVNADDNVGSVFCDPVHFWGKVKSQLNESKRVNSAAPLKFTIVNRDTCISCGACQMAAPDIFDADDEGLAFSIIDNNQGIRPIPEELLMDLDDAYEGCPTESIQVSDVPFKTASPKG